MDWTRAINFKVFFFTSACVPCWPIVIIGLSIILVCKKPMSQWCCSQTVKDMVPSSLLVPQQLVIMNRNIQPNPLQMMDLPFKWQIKWRQWPLKDMAQPSKIPLQPDQKSGGWNVFYTEAPNQQICAKKNLSVLQIVSQ